VAYDGMELYFPKEKIRFTGNPIRKDITNLVGKKERALEIFGFESSKRIIFVTGGSLGSKTLNDCTAAALDRLAEEKIQLLWQTGSSYFSQAQEIVKNYPDMKIFCSAFIKEMDYAYSLADLVISRAGAGALSELCMVHKAAVLVPYPFAAEDHQTKNAQALVNHKAAMMVSDTEAPSKLYNIAIGLILNEEERSRLENNITKLAVNDAAETIASEVYNLAIARK
jgi:UDP-N-acetylglucosamine--N-acetylmuramyl-(pentapeptide) pyrophosphoryl-undecaprenol N-acetylglucosamine transferase